MARRRPRRQSDSGIGWAGAGGIALILLAIACGGALAYFYFSRTKPPVLDKQSLCPIDGPHGINVVLVDTTDDLSETTRREAQVLLNDLIVNLPAFYRLDIRVLDIPGARSRSLFSRCNPGDGTGLSEWTDNPRIARQRWIENFRKPASEAIEGSLSSAKAASSPLMGAIQDIAISDFAGAANQSAKKSLIVISDMIEYTRDYSQYPKDGDLSFQRYKQSPVYLKFRTELHGAAVTVRYVTRQQAKGQPVLDDRKHAEFWTQWMKDNGASAVEFKRLQGA